MLKSKDHTERNARSIIAIMLAEVEHTCVASTVTAPTKEERIFSPLLVVHPPPTSAFFENAGCTIYSPTVSIPSSHGVTTSHFAFTSPSAFNFIGCIFPISFGSFGVSIILLFLSNHTISILPSVKYLSKSSTSNFPSTFISIVPFTSAIYVPLLVILKLASPFARFSSSFSCSSPFLFFNIILSIVSISDKFVTVTFTCSSSYVCPSCISLHLFDIAFLLIEVLLLQIFQ